MSHVSFQISLDFFLKGFAQQDIWNSKPKKKKKIVTQLSSSVDKIIVYDTGFSFSQWESDWTKK